MRIKRIAVATLVALLSLGIVGCDNPVLPVDTTVDMHSSEVRVGDRAVPCVSWTYGYEAGVTCDWGNAR